MKFEFEVADRLRTVEVHREARGFRVIVDGRPRVVDAVRVAGDAWSLVIRDGDDAAQARSVEAVVTPQPATGGLDVHVGGHHVLVNRRGGHGRRTREGGSTSGTGPQRITTPMPGKVVRVLVKAGDEVKPRQSLVVVEAMKMENDLRASREGRVREVLAREGQSVDAGTVLVIVE